MPGRAWAVGNREIVFNMTEFYFTSVSYSSIILERVDHLVIRTDFKDSQKHAPQEFPDIHTKLFTMGKRRRCRPRPGQK